MPEPAAAVETHTAVVVFIGDRAYKVKKPVNLGFLDFSTVAARAEACRREVQLNRRMAPDVYLGVADVTDVDGKVCDHLVVMRRMPSVRRLSACIERGEDVDEAVRQVARDLAAMHESGAADPAWSYVASVERIRRNWDDNFDTMRSFSRPVFDERVMARVDRLAHRYLEGRRPLFDRRIAEGRVRDGHGDLQADDIFLLDDGPRVLDCLEFSDELRWADVLNDVAFLAMDLERLGRADLAERFLAWHREFTADSWPPSLAHHYVAYRAHVRAKVAAIRYDQGDDGAAALARQLLDLTRTHLEQAAVRLVLVGGAPGTGKSTLSDALATHLPVAVLRSDEVRAGSPAATPAAYGEGRYTAEAVTANYEQLVAKARTLLGLGESVVLDASWSSAAMRELAREAARATASDLVEVRCDAPVDVAAERIAVRRPGGASASEATPAIAEEMARRFEPWPEATTIDTARPLAHVVDDLLHAVAAD